MNFAQLTGRSEEHLCVFEDDFKIYKPIEKDLCSFLSSIRQAGFDAQLASSYRSFDRQLLIWNEKAEGKRPLFDPLGNELDYNKLSEEKILQSMLYWSAIPGTSRHHWGTDFDLYDAAGFQDQKLKLLNCEYENDGPCAAMTQFIAKNPSVFFRPYQGSKLIQEEKWHYSHRHFSLQFFQLYDYQVFEKNIQMATQLAFRDYLLSNCLKFYQAIQNSVTL